MRADRLWWPPLSSGSIRAISSSRGQGGENRNPPGPEASENPITPPPPSPHACFDGLGDRCSAFKNGKGESLSCYFQHLTCQFHSRLIFLLRHAIEICIGFAVSCPCCLETWELENKWYIKWFLMARSWKSCQDSILLIPSPLFRTICLLICGKFFRTETFFCLAISICHGAWTWIWGWVFGQSVCGFCIRCQRSVSLSLTVTW